MKICFLTAYHGSWTKQEVLILREQGHGVSDFSTSDYGEVKRFPFVPLLGGISLSLKMLLRSISASLKSDVIYCWFIFPTGVIAIILGKLFRKAVLLNASGCDVAYVPSINYGDPAIPYFRPFISWTLRNATRVIALSQHIARWAEVWGGRNIGVIYEGIDVEKFKPDPKLKDTGANPCLLSVSALVQSEVERKDLKTLLEAVSKTVKVFPDLELIIVGKKGDAYLPLERMTEELGIKRNVIFEGFISLPQLINLYRKCDIIIHPSLYESFPTICAEAMACEKPVITTNVASMPEIVKDGETGLVVKPGDSGALAEAIKKLLSDTALCARFGKAGRRRVVELFSKQVRAKKIQEVLVEMHGEVVQRA